MNIGSDSFKNSTELTADDFISGAVMDEYNTINGTWALKLYLPKWKYWLKIRDDWENVANSNKNQSITVASINCNEHNDACLRFQTDGYPSIYVIENGLSYRFKQKRGYDNFMNFIQSGNYISLGEEQEIFDYDAIPKTAIGRYFRIFSSLSWALKTFIIVAFIITIGAWLVL